MAQETSGRYPQNARNSPENGPAEWKIIHPGNAAVGRVKIPMEVVDLEPEDSRAVATYTRAEALAIQRREESRAKLEALRREQNRRATAQAVRVLSPVAGAGTAIGVALMYVSAAHVFLSVVVLVFVSAFVSSLSNAVKYQRTGQDKRTGGDVTTNVHVNGTGGNVTTNVFVNYKKD